MCNICLLCAVCCVLCALCVWGGRGCRAEVVLQCRGRARFVSVCVRECVCVCVFVYCVGG